MVPPPEPAAAAALVSDGPEADPRARLLRAMSGLVAERGLAQATVAAVVARARVSRRTFYEHFDDRDDCFVAAYRLIAERLAGGVLRATEGVPWPARLDAVMDGYLGELAARPELARAVVLDVRAAGPTGMAARREAMEVLADLLVGLAQEARREGADVGPLPRGLALALLGGLEELVLRRVEEGRPASLPELAGDARLLARRVVGAG